MGVLGQTTTFLPVITKIKPHHLPFNYLYNIDLFIESRGGGGGGGGTSIVK